MTALARATSDTSWPPALVYFAIGIAALALGVFVTVYRRARHGLRARKAPSRR